MKSCSPLGKQDLRFISSPIGSSSIRNPKHAPNGDSASNSPTMTSRRVRFGDSCISRDADDYDKDEQLQETKERESLHSIFPLSIFAALTWFALSAIVLWCRVLPGATELWTAQASLQQSVSDRMLILDNSSRLPGGYRSVEEMNARSTRFPSIDERVRVYMSNWYQSPCAQHARRNTTSFDDTVYIQYNYLRDTSDPEQPPLLAVQELKIPMELLDQDLDSSDPTERKFANSGNNRVFIVDNTVIDKGARLFFMTADRIRECDKAFCVDFVKFVFPSLHRADMSLLPVQQHPSQQQQYLAAPSYPGNALDALDGNINAIAPVLLQFGDLEVTRAWVVTSGKNETYPAVPIQKKFRWSMSRDELDRTTSEDPCNWEHRPIPTTRSGSKRLQPIISKLTYRRHFGMLDEIPANDTPWSEKKDAAVFRGALTGMKRGGFRVVQEAHKGEDKLSMCMSMQRCRLVYMSHNSSLVNASLTGTLTYHAHNMIDGPVVPAVLNGVPLYGSRMSYAELLQYKALIMLEGNDISSGFKWALYSNSVVLAQRSLYTSWAMEELLVPWLHFIPLDDDLSDVEEKMQWVLGHDEEAQKIAHAGQLWISDLIYHPDAPSDDEAVFDNTLRRYKQHFVHNPDLSGELLVQVK